MKKCDGTTVTIESVESEKKNIGVNVDNYVWISIFKHRLTRQIK